MKELDPEFLQFEPFINYESILCIPTMNNEGKTNISVMGVHFTADEYVYLHVSEGKATKSLLQPGALFSINFSENFYDYVLATLKKSGGEQTVFDLSLTTQYSEKEIPALSQAWAIAFCEVIPMPELAESIPCKRRQNPNIRARILSKKIVQLPKFFNNRAFALAMEALLYAFRIPSYGKLSQEYSQSLEYFKWIKQKILSWREMARYQLGFEAMDNYLINNGVTLHDLFND